MPAAAQTEQGTSQNTHLQNGDTKVVLRKSKRLKEKKFKMGETDELTRLLQLVDTPLNQQVPSISLEDTSASISLQWPTPTNKKQPSNPHQCSESESLEQFSLTYKNERNLSNHPHKKFFTQICSSLTKQRLCNAEWMESAPPENILRCLVCLRILVRDPVFQKDFISLGGVTALAQHLQKATSSYLTYGDGPYVVDILKEMTNIVQKISLSESQRELVIQCKIHESLVLLVSASDVIVLHCSMYALISLAQSAEPRSLIAQLNSIETILRIIQDYDILSKKLGANLLRLLLSDSKAREMVKVFDGLPMLLNLLHCDSVKLLWNIVWCLVLLCEDKEIRDDIRQMGGIQLLLSLLHDRKFVSDRSAANSVPPGRTPTCEEPEFPWTDKELSPLKQAEEVREHTLSLKSACCACLTELARNDTNAHHIVQNNGIYLIALLILPQKASERERNNLQMNAFRTLRFVFSMERNRRLFKRLFQPDMFELFIDIGHYKHELGAYKPLVHKINKLCDDKLEDVRENIQLQNQNREPSNHIGEYAVLELLGTGGFGSVYKVRKKTAGQSYLAMKEINTVHPAWGKSSKERQTSIGEAVNELTIIKEKLKHPNVVRYYKTFVENEKLYIVMELIEGAPLHDHFTSLKEKGESFGEARIWNIFIQLVLALRYLHKEKGIVHRDLSPNNIMLGEYDKVTITDFGLAKQKQKDCSKMLSVVGTILYSCPEIIQYKPYDEKSDVWSIGCVLYQMCTLNAPFYSNNLMHLATMIVEAKYEPIKEGVYTDQLVSTVKSCITSDPKQRPDIVQVAALIADKVLIHLDTVHKDQVNLQKKLEQEKKRTQKHYMESYRNKQKYHQLFQVSQERYEKLVNLAGSGGATSIKDEEIQDTTFSDLDSSNGKSCSCNHSGNDSSHHASEQNESGWASDDEAGSSGSDSREVSRNKVFPKPPIGPRLKKSSSKQSLLNSSCTSQLSLDIPKISRDSGLGSDDHSPSNLSTHSPKSTSSSPNNTSPSSDSSLVSPGNTESHNAARPRSFNGSINRSVSMTAVENMAKRTMKSRPNSATTLTVSPHRVRQISDPILQMLHQLHKVIYITQLPPTLSHSSRRRAIEHFKRALFAPQSTSHNLKDELRKLLTGSDEVIDLHLGVGEFSKLAKQLSEEQEAVQVNSMKNTFGITETEGAEVGITYEQMQSIIESLLVESGYYDMSGPHHKSMGSNPDLYSLAARLKST